MILYAGVGESKAYSCVLNTRMSEQIVFKDAAVWAERQK